MEVGNVKIAEEGTVRRSEAAAARRGYESTGRTQARGKDLVPSLYDISADGRSHNRRT